MDAFGACAESNSGTRMVETCAANVPIAPLVEACERRRDSRTPGGYAGAGAP